jgi:hypothetical protein
MAGGNCTLPSKHAAEWQKMMKDFIFYTIAANIIALIATLAGASLAVIIFSSLLIPPVILIIIRLIR